jgi:hypothetical protein
MVFCVVITCSLLNAYQTIAVFSDDPEEGDSISTKIMKSTYKHTGRHKLEGHNQNFRHSRYTC